MPIEIYFVQSGFVANFTEAVLVTDYINARCVVLFVEVLFIFCLNKIKSNNYMNVKMK